MQSLDQYIETIFGNTNLKKIYASQAEFDTLKEWIKTHARDSTEYRGCYEQRMGRFPKGERDFYVASDKIVVSYNRPNFRNNTSAQYRGEKDWAFYEKFTGIYYLLKYQILVKS